MKRRFFDFAVIIMFFISASCFIYSPLSQCLNENAALKTTEQYDTQIIETTEIQKQEQFKKAKQYNKKLTNNKKSNLNYEKEYQNILNIKDGMMGYIEIPKINVKLPIYHGTDKVTLEKGIGHLKNSTLPIGGKGTHSVLTGHTGVPSAKLFDDINLLKINDCFQIKIFDNTLVYKIKRIKTVLPNKFGKLLETQSSKDEVTLITCVPYGINNLRLLVTGERTKSKIEYKEKQIAKSAKDRLIIRIIIILIVAATLSIINLYSFINHKRQVDKLSTQYDKRR